MSRHLKPIYRANRKDAEYFLFSVTKENQKNIKKHFSKNLELFDHVSSLYFYLFFSIKNFKTIDDGKPSRLFYITQYLVPIINNFHSSKILFNSGMHSQMQVILRTQVEFINTFIALTSDKEYFDHFATPNEKIKTLSTTITPKLNNADKAIKKMLSEKHKGNSNKLWSAYVDSRKEIYDDLSETAHGNIPRLSLQSMNHNNKSELITSAIGGHSEPSKFTLYTVNTSSIYFQVSFKFIYENLKDLNYINEKSEWIEYLDYYNNQLFSNK